MPYLERSLFLLEYIQVAEPSLCGANCAPQSCFALLVAFALLRLSRGASFALVLAGVKHVALLHYAFAFVPRLHPSMLACTVSHQKQDLQSLAELRTRKQIECNANCQSSEWHPRMVIQMNKGLVVPYSVLIYIDCRTLQLMNSFSSAKTQNTATQTAPAPQPLFPAPPQAASHAMGRVNTELRGAHLVLLPIFRPLCACYGACHRAKPAAQRPGRWARGLCQCSCRRRWMALCYPRGSQHRLPHCPPTLRSATMEQGPLQLRDLPQKRFPRRLQEIRKQLRHRRCCRAPQCSGRPGPHRHLPARCSILPHFWQLPVPCR